MKTPSSAMQVEINNVLVASNLPRQKNFSTALSVSTHPEHGLIKSILISARKMGHYTGLTPIR